MIFKFIYVLLYQDNQSILYIFIKSKFLNIYFKILFVILFNYMAFDKQESQKRTPDFFNWSSRHL